MISIIIPAHNSERYVRDCVVSILANDMLDTEITLVDDGSTDATSAICDELAASHSTVHVIHRENGGPAAARNTGIESAVHGPDDWIWFVDSDDLVSKGSIDSLRAWGSISDADALYFGLVRFRDGETADWKGSHEVKYGTLAPEEFLSGTYSGKYDHYLFRFLFRWNALERLLARRKAEGHLHLFDEDYSLLEDLVFVEEFMHGPCHSIQTGSHVLYGYRQVATSMVREISSKAADSALRAVRHIDNFSVSKTDEPHKQRMQIRLLFNAYRAAGTGDETRGLRCKIRGEIIRRAKETGVCQLSRPLLLRYFALRTGLGDLFLKYRG